MTEEELLYNRRGKILGVVDGDTIDVEVDFGFGIFMRPVGKFKIGRFRLYGINAPETGRRATGLTDAQWEAEKAAGLKSKARLAEILPVGASIVFASKKPDMYGRWLALVWLNIADAPLEPKTVNAQMLNEQLAKANSYGNEPLKLV